MEILEARITPAAGAFDLSFGENGTAREYFFVDKLTDYFTAVELLDDGRVLAAGVAEKSNNNTFPNFTVARFLADGTPDPTFGRLGVTMSTAPEQFQTPDSAFAVLGLPEGKVLVAGKSKDNFALVRYEADGDLDPTFGTGGWLVTDMGGVDQALSIALRPNGGIILAGRSDSDMAVAAYTAAGGLDTTFSGDGKLLLNLGGADVAEKVAIDASGKILLAGTNGSDFAVVRLTAAGAKDNSFGSAGIARVDFGGTEGATALAVSADGIFVAGATAGGYGVAKLTSAGVLANAFGAAGKAQIAGTDAADKVGALGVLADGHVLVAGTADFEAGVAKLTSAGAPAPDFGTAGFVKTDLLSFIAETADIRADGQIAIAGRAFPSFSETNSGVARLNASGAIDPTFSGDGIASVAVKDAGSFNLADVAAQPDGKLLVLGEQVTFTDANVELLRFNANGELDLSFGVGGQLSLDYNGFENFGVAMAVQADGKILIIGSIDDSDTLVARVLPSGQLDTTYGTGGWVRIAEAQMPGPSGIVLDPDGSAYLLGRVPAPGGFFSNDTQLVRLLPSGAVDTNFGVAGFTKLDIAPSESPRAIARQSDGKIVVAVSTGDASGFGVARFLPNGTPDVNFGSGGIAKPSWGGTEELPTGIAFTAGGQILLGGTSKQNFTGKDFAVLRLNANGTLDGAFGVAGVRLIDFGGAEDAGGLVVQADGKIIIGGSGTAVNGQKPVAARLTADGALDESFGILGKVTRPDDGASAFALGTVLTPDGKVVIARDSFGSLGHEAVLVRLETAAPVAPPQGLLRFSAGQFLTSEADGTATVTLTRTGGSAGEVTVSYRSVDSTALAGRDYAAVSGTLTFPAGVTTASFTIPISSDLSAEGDEHIRVELSNPAGGAALDNPSVALVTIVSPGGQAGTLDKTFEANPKTFRPVLGNPRVEVTDALAQPDGKTIVVFGNTSEFQLARFLPNGSPDPTFGFEGLAETDFGESYDNSYGAALLPDGKILVVGAMHQDGTRIGLVRYLANGTLDRTFGAGGRVVMETPERSYGTDIEVLADGKFLVLSQSGEVLRFLADGTLDTAFGNKSYVNTPLTEHFPSGRVRMAVQPNGGILLSGQFGFGDTEEGGTSVYRLTAAGKIDTAFGTNGRTRAPQIGNNTELEVLPDGRFVVAGNSSGGFGAAVFTAAGRPDLSFSGDGFASVEFSVGSADGVLDMLVQRDGKIVLFGSSDTGSLRQTAFTRLNQDGTLDTSFGTGGKTLLPYRLGGDGAVTLLPDNKIAFATSTAGPTTSGYPLHLRLGQLFNDPANGEIAFSGSAFTVDENAANASIVLTRKNGTDGAVTVRLTTANGTATAGKDYTARSIEVTFAPGEAVKTVLLPILDDALRENLETVKLSLSAPTGGAVLGQQKTATLDILDGPGAFQFVFDAFAQNESGGTATITVSRTGGSDGAVSVNYNTANGEALSGQDYSATSGTLSFADGQTSATFTIPLLDDAEQEGRESVRLSLSAPTGGATLGKFARAVLNIYDDDTPGAANAGAPVLDFAENGSYTLDAGGSDLARASLRQADGKYLVVGESDSDVVIGRFEADGSLDLGFGEAGSVVYDFGGIETARAVVQQPDGKLVIAGYTIRNGESDFLLARFLADGSLDPSFGIGGVVRTDFNGNSDQAFSVALQQDGKIVVAGNTGNPFARDFAIARYLADGTLDESFGGDNGLVTVDYDGRFDSAVGIAVQPDQRIVVGGTSLFIYPENTLFFRPDSDAALVRLLPDGSLDKSFGQAGKVQESFPVVTSLSSEEYHTMLLAPDGKIYLGGSNDGDMMIARFLPNGAPDTSWGHGLGAFSATFLSAESIGGSFFSSDVVYALSLDAEGRLLATGASSNELGLVRLTKTGRVDRSFGVAGRVVQGDFGDGVGIFPEQDGSITVVGSFLDFEEELDNFRYDVDFYIARFKGNSGETKEGSFQFTQFSTSASETSFGGILTVAVARPIDFSFGAVTVDYYTLPGSATAGVDYIPVQGTLHFADGESVKIVEIPLIADGLAEDAESFKVVLANPTGGAQLGSQPVLTAFIEKNSGTFGFTADFISSVSETGGSVTVTINRGTSIGAASIAYRTVEGTATAGEDYLPISGVVQFASGQRTKTISIPIISDTKLEADETFTLQLFDPINGELFSSERESTVTILDADPTLIRNAGDLDTTWSGDGRTSTPTAPDDGADEILAMAYQPDGKLVAVGISGGKQGGFGLIRYNLDGSLDSTFGNGGKVFTDIRPGGDRAYAVHVLPDGKLLVVGDSIGDGHQALAAVRYLPNGKLDPTYGQGGKVLHQLASYGDDLPHVAFFPDGSFIAGGSTLTGNFDTDLALVKISANGSVDTTFGRGGFTTYDFHERAFLSFNGLTLDEEVSGLALLPSGKILVSERDGRLFRFNADGALDRTFGVNGVLSFTTEDTFINFGRLALTPEGDVLVTGETDFDFALFKFDQNGVPIAAFGTNGVATSPNLDSSFVTTIAVQPDGRILVSKGGFNTSTVVRFFSDGAIDPGFGARGRVISGIEVNTIIVGPDGTITFGGGRDAFETERHIGGVSPGAFRFEAGDVRVGENGATLQLKVFRIGGIDGAASVSFATTDGTAKAGIDYTAVSGQLSFADRNAAPQIISIPILNDQLVQGNLQFTISLTNPTGGTVLAAPIDKSTVTIVDDEAAGKFIIGADGFATSEAAGSVQVLIKRIDGSGGPASVRLTSSDGSAKAGVDFPAVNQVVSFAAGETEKTVTLPITPDALGEPEEYFNLDLSEPSTGAAIGFRGPSQVFIAQDFAPETFSLATGTATIDESAGSYAVVIQRTGRSDLRSGVSLSVTPGTAKAILDYSFEPEFVTFLPGETQKTVFIPILNDSTAEDAETLAVSITSASALGISQTVVTITDDDGVPPLRVAINNVILQEGSSGTNQAIFTVSLSRNATSTVTVDFSTANETAGAGDYTAVNGQLTFQAGERTKQIAVPVLGDMVFEQTERFLVNLSNPSGVAIADGRGIGTIQNDDLEPRGVEFVASTYTVAENRTAVTITLQRPAGSTGALAVPYTLAPGTAIEGKDYTGVSGVANFAAGASVATFTVPLRRDFLAEADETFTITLGTPQGGTLGVRTTATVRILDDDPTALPDLNNDGAPDLVLLKAGKVYIHLNPGDGHFPVSDATAGIATVAKPVSWVAGDFNNDGNIDLALLSTKTKTISILAGNGDGTFDAPAAFASGPKKAISTKGLTAADFNGDGRTDLAALSPKGINVLTNTSTAGGLSFAPGRQAIAGKGFATLATGDFNEDGQLDLLATRGGAKAAALVFAGRDGGFAPGAVVTSLGSGAKSVQVADFDGDGHLDLAAILPKNRIGFASGLGTGAFQPPAFVDAGKGPAHFAFHDLDGDLDLDVVTLSSKKIATIITNKGAGVFESNLAGPVGLAPASIALADVNGDDIPDLILLGKKDNFQVLIGQADGTAFSAI